MSHARTTTPTHTHNISPTLSQNDGASVCFGVKVHWDGEEEDVESKKKILMKCFCATNKMMMKNEEEMSVINF